MINLPSSLEIEKLIQQLRVLSWEASDILLYYSQILKDENNNSNILKNDNKEDPVTVADLKVNDLVIRRINEINMDIRWGILSEENVKISYKKWKSNSDWIWVLDPLDGTKDFIQGTGDYAMHLSLNYKKRPYIVIVLIPEKDELWISHGQKVWCENREQICSIPHLLNNKSLKEMSLVTSKNHNNETLRDLIDKISFNKIKIMGSIGCKIASILRGESDIYICLSLPGKSTPKDWDFSAPEAILKAAGGAITNINNQDLTYGKSNFQHEGIIIASNNKLNHGKICSRIKEIIKKNNLYPILD